MKAPRKLAPHLNVHPKNEKNEENNHSNSYCFRMQVHADANIEQRVAELEKEVAELKTALAPFIEEAKAEQIVTEQRNAAKKRMREDSE